jgi:hypothetical protein
VKEVLTARPDGTAIPMQIHIKHTLFMMCDGMSQHSSLIPTLTPFPKNLSSSQRLSSKLIGVTVINGPRIIYQVLPDQASVYGPQAANETIACLEESMRLMCSMGYRLDAERLAVNLDNHAGSNKTPAILLWGGSLVYHNVFTKVKFKYLTVGHTHNLQVWMDE